MFIFSRLVIKALKKVVFSTHIKKKDDESNVESVKVYSDNYYTSLYSQNTFDVYIPEKKIMYSPTIIWVHGGGLIGGDKSETKNYAVSLANLGYTVFSLNYNLVPDSKYPEPVQQLSEFIEYLSQNTTKYGIDITNLFLAGNSAGAQVVAQFVTIQSNTEYSKKINVEMPKSFYEVRGILLFCGYFSFKDLIHGDISKFSAAAFNEISKLYFMNSNWSTSSLSETSSIYNYISKNFPPAYITDGNTYSIEKQSQKLVKYLREYHSVVSWRFFDKEEMKVKHDFQFNLNTEAGKLAFEDVKKFLDQTRKK